MAATISKKTVVVTGGSRGIGLGLVKRFLARGNTVFATTRNAADASNLKALQAQYSKLNIAQLDVSQPASITAFAQGLKEDLKHIDVLYNNAGVYGRRVGLEDTNTEDFLYAFQSNAIGPFLVTQQLHKQGLIGAPGGETLVVNQSSIMSSHGDPVISSNMGGAYAYRASKAALNIINKSLQFDLKDQGVQCLLVHPGYVKTDMTGGEGYIDVDTSADGIMAMLESGRPLAGRFYGFDGAEIPW